MVLLIYKWLYKRQPFSTQKCLYTQLPGLHIKMAIYTAAVSNAYMSIYTASGPHKKCLPRNEALEKENRIDEMKKIKTQPTSPAPAASTAGPCPTICQSSRRPGTGSLPAPSPDQTIFSETAEPIKAKFHMRPQWDSLPAPSPDPTTHYIEDNRSETKTYTTSIQIVDIRVFRLYRHFHMLARLSCIQPILLWKRLSCI